MSKEVTPKYVVGDEVILTIADQPKYTVGQRVAFKEDGSLFSTYGFVDYVETGNPQRMYRVRYTQYKWLSQSELEATNDEPSNR